MKDKNQKMIEWQAQAEKLVLAKHKVNQRIIEISLNSLIVEGKQERGPLNLSLVLDRSGSMQGEKLKYVRKAAAHVVDLMQAKDRLGVVIYDNVITELFASAEMTEENKAEVKKRIQEVHSGGSTDLGGGWLKGCSQVAANSNERTFNRTLLLTDGLANVGMTSLEELATHASELFRRGVSTSTFGVGVGYDEHLLEAMATTGGGRFHFLETMQAIPLEFEREFQELINICLKDVAFSLMLPQGVTLEVAGGYQPENDGSHFKVFTGCLFSGQKQSLYLRLNIAEGASAKDLVIPISLKAKYEDGTPFEASTTLTFKAVTAQEEAAVAADKDLMERYSAVFMADAANEALRRERRGDRSGASQVIQDSLNLNSPYLSRNGINKYQTMSSEMVTGLNESQRKNYHYQEYQNKRGSLMVRDYPAELVNGCLFTRIDDQHILVDSGSPVSAGKRAEWIFMNQSHQLATSALGVSPAYLSQEIGHPVDMLMGTDILKHYVLTVDLKNGILNFSEHAVKIGKFRAFFKVMAGVPIIRGKLAGETVEMFVDTGAKLTYVEKQMVAGLTPIRQEQDFYPTIGRFTTPVFELPLEINGGVKLQAQVGILPEKLESTLLVTGAKAILGTQLFKHYTISMDFVNREIWLT